MKKLLSLLLVFGLCAGLTACGDEEPNNEDQTPAKEVYEIGETAEADGIKFTVTKAEEREGIFDAEDGNIYYVIEVAIENTTDDVFNSSSIMCYSLKDGDGRELDQSIAVELNGSLDTEVDAGEKGIGEIAYEIPEDTEELTLKITPGFGDSVKFNVK